MMYWHFRASNNWLLFREQVCKVIHLATVTWNVVFMCRVSKKLRIPYCKGVAGNHSSRVRIKYNYEWGGSQPWFVVSLLEAGDGGPRRPGGDATAASPLKFKYGPVTRSGRGSPRSPRAYSSCTSAGTSWNLGQWRSHPRKGSFSTLPTRQV